MLKQDRGVNEAFGDRKVVFCQWNDNRPICVINNLGKLSQSILYEDGGQNKGYNKRMGRVDIVDNGYLSDYRPRLRNKKWWWWLFSNFLNMTVVAAWRLHQKLNGEISHLQFRREKVPDKLRPGPSKMPANGVNWWTRLMWAKLPKNKGVANYARKTPHACAKCMTCCCMPNAFICFTNVCSKCPFLASTYLQSKSILYVFNMISLCMKDRFEFVPRNLFC